MKEQIPYPHAFEYPKTTTKVPQVLTGNDHFQLNQPFIPQHVLDEIEYRYQYLYENEEQDVSEEEQDHVY